MKKILLFFMLVVMAFNAYADDYVTIDDVTIRPGGRAQMVIRYHFDSEKICAYQFQLQFPKGITADLESAANGPTIPSSYNIAGVDKGNNHYMFATFSYGSGTGNEPITDHEGVLLTMTVNADASLTSGSVLDATAYELIFPENQAKATTNNGDADAGQANVDSGPSQVEGELPDVNFKIIIDENAGYVDLFETAEVAPKDSNDVDVRVYRTIKAGEWSTICLPFDMSESEVKSSFGNDVELADFKGCDFVYYNDDELIQINTKFESVKSIEANHPYIIKVSKAIEKFFAYRVNIHVDEASVDCDRIGKGTSRDPYKWNSFIGTYTANTEVPEGALFLADNKFWYSKGKTNMKAFRGYFDFYYLLNSYGNPSAKVSILLDGTPTSIEEVNTKRVVGNDDIFTISGMNVGKDASRLQRGVYIVNGKKVVKK